MEGSFLAKPILIDILAILPIPQVVLLLFTKKEVSKSQTYLSLLIVQYILRIFRINQSEKAIGKEFDSLILRVWVRCVLSLYISLLASHFCGALWYFNAIVRELQCLETACKHQEGCGVGIFYCGSISNPKRNLTFLYEVCTVNPTNNAPVFDFGIYKDAIESRILGTRNFSIKFYKCIWWGLQNLSSFGQSLNTSKNVLENIYAITICIMGIILSVCLVGFNMQTFMQLTTTAREERLKTSAKEKEIRSNLSSYKLPIEKEKVIVKHLVKTIKENKDFEVKYLFSLLEKSKDDEQHKSETFEQLTTKTVCTSTTKRSAESWMSENDIPFHMQGEIMQFVQLGMLLEGKDKVDFGDILHFLPPALQISVKIHLCLETLKQVPKLEKMDEKLYEAFCSYLKPVIYSENTYIIREGEPVDLMLFITQGIIWMFGKTSMERLKGGHYYGKELLEWQFELKSISTFPISTRNVKSHTKVEALALTAIDLEDFLSKNWYKFSPSTHSSLDDSTLIEINSTGEFRRRIANKKENENELQEINDN